MSHRVEIQSLRSSFQLLPVEGNAEAHAKAVSNLIDALMQERPFFEIGTTFLCEEERVGALERLAHAKNAMQALECCAISYAPTLVGGLILHYENSRVEKIALVAIAPAVVSGSYVQIRSEYGGVWDYEFTDERVYVYQSAFDRFG